MKKNWKDTPLLSKIALIASIVVAFAIIVLAIMQIFDLWSNAGYVYIPLMGINLLLQAYTQWKQNRCVAVFSLCAAVFVLACAIAVYIIK